MFLLHRLSGILLFLFILIHISTTNKLKNDTTNEFYYFLKSIPFINFFEYILILLVLIHTFLGIRILLLESELVSARNINVNIAIIVLIFIFSLLILILGDFL